MLDNEIKVTLVRGKSIANSEYDVYIEILKTKGQETKINICKSLLKIEITRLIEPIIKGSGLSNLKVTNKLVEDIDYSAFINITKSTHSSVLLARIIHGELFRVAVESSPITNIEYAQYLNSIYDEIYSICNNIVQLLNA